MQVTSDSPAELEDSDMDDSDASSELDLNLVEELGVTSSSDSELEDSDLDVTTSSDYSELEDSGLDITVSSESPSELEEDATTQAHTAAPAHQGIATT